ncbi:hypothetical protein KKE60_06280 [Patescibacteria group bacterium]|nr:hypothetical protein [Patescibacteria group bacterium]
MPEHINAIIRPKSFGLSIYKSTGERFIDKKIIYTMIRSISDTGIAVIECELSNISDVYNVCRPIGPTYILLFANGENAHSKIYVIIGNIVMTSEVSIITRPYSDIYTEIVLSYSNTQDYVLAIGDEMVPVSYLSKRLCRHVIAFTHLSHEQEYEGLSHVYLEEK